MDAARAQPRVRGDVTDRLARLLRRQHRPRQPLTCLFEHCRRLRDVPQMSLRHRREVFTTTQPRYSLSKPLNKKSRVCGFVSAEGASEQLPAGVAFANPAL